MATAVNIVLGGKLEQFVNRYIREGYATSKTEVLRLGLIKLKQEEEKYEDISDDPELLDYLRKVQSGEIKPKIVGGYKDLKKLLTRP
jgi:Arc/MetJ-type ribon-helix-helix transcriptional regulator